MKNLIHQLFYTTSSSAHSAKHPSYNSKGTIHNKFVPKRPTLSAVGRLLKTPTITCTLLALKFELTQKYSASKSQYCQINKKSLVRICHFFTLDKRVAIIIYSLSLTGRFPSPHRPASELIAQTVVKHSLRFREEFYPYTDWKKG